MARAPSLKKQYKVHLHEGMDPFLQHLATLGLYGSNASEVIARLVETQVQSMVADGTFEKAKAAIELVRSGNPTSRNNK